MPSSAFSTTSRIPFLRFSQGLFRPLTLGDVPPDAVDLHDAAAFGDVFLANLKDPCFVAGSDKPDFKDPLFIARSLFYRADA